MAGPYTLIPHNVQWLQGTPATQSATGVASGVTTGAGGVLVLNGQSARVTFACMGSSTTGAITTGAISIEEAYWDPNDAQAPGTWSVITTVSGANLTTGAQQVVHVNASAWAVRARISTAMSTGSVLVAAWGN